jgi:phosphoribosylformylglycinamidine synthase
MATTWQDHNQAKQVVAPVSLIISAFAPVRDVRKTLTPQLQLQTETELILIDLGRNQNRMAGSIVTQVFEQTDTHAPNVDQASDLKSFTNAIITLRERNAILAYHDRSDGGLLACIAEMAFASHCGISLNVDLLCIDPQTEPDYGDAKNWATQVSGRRHEQTMRALFSEELGVVIQIERSQRDVVFAVLRECGISAFSHVIGKPNQSDVLEIWRDAKCVYTESRLHLQKLWQNTSYQIARLRDNPNCVDSEYQSVEDVSDPGMSPILRFDPNENPSAPFINKGTRPKMAILREQGVNSHLEMAYAMDLASFASHDVHMSDLLTGQAKLEDYQGLVACGGFSYGDVLGAGEGWAKTILFNPQLSEQFASFFQRNDSFALGVCNGCQMMSNLASLIPGAKAWPKFTRNQSEQYEARLVMVEILQSPSLFFSGMSGSHLPIAVAHGEGFANFKHQGNARKIEQDQLAAMRFIDHHGQATERYPFNPNGSPLGLTSVTTADGRFTVMMPHPERVFRNVQMSWYPKEWNQTQDGASPWLRMFRNARVWVN